MCYPIPLTKCHAGCECDRERMFCHYSPVTETRWCTNDRDCDEGWTCKRGECYFESNSTCTVQETASKCGSRSICDNFKCIVYTPQCWRNTDCQGTG